MLSMRRQRSRSVSPWLTATPPIGLEMVLFFALSAVPLFLIAGVAFLLEEVGVIHINTLLVWRFVLVGIGLAILLELHPFRFQLKG